MSVQRGTLKSFEVCLSSQILKMGRQVFLKYKKTQYFLFCDFNEEADLCLIRNAIFEAFLFLVFEKKGDMAELVDALASGASDSNIVRVRVSLSPHKCISLRR